MADQTTTTTTVTDGGRIVIPAPYRRALGIKAGDEVLLRLENGEVRISSRAQARRRAQEYVRTLVPRNVSLVAELIKERRETADD
ncbi:MAG TPA: AbrB/MazE/SpoVT family DNA-binding domain-containing protein [Bryobacteraceae bacterium]|nr:AbrB/MazE/SpoVT family DNA-binding domain-containing protein [Bryobacteraceae bacterium]